jgi:hypothetical protein
MTAVLFIFIVVFFVVFLSTTIKLEARIKEVEEWKERMRDTMDNTWDWLELPYEVRKEAMKEYSSQATDEFLEAVEKVGEKRKALEEVKNKK